MEVADRRLDAGEDPRGVEQIGRARRRGIGDFAIFVGARPALAGIDEAQIVEAEIGHRARAHADVHRQLRANQNDRRSAAERGLVLSVPAPTIAAGYTTAASKAMPATHSQSERRTRLNTIAKSQAKTLTT